ncbi:hypothetical protein Tco_0774322 [Tanacetum coccineum]|uniref:Uncharacterized protein n=1 Tax=Tanacetum coccineum TaxID=301880 RepID=A0ABQ4ZQW1_9ASTR
MKDGIGTHNPWKTVLDVTLPYLFSRLIAVNRFRTSIDNENGVSHINDDCGNSNEMYDNVEDAIGDNDQEILQTLLEDSQKPAF